MLYTLLRISEIAVPESIRALNCFPAWTVTVGQSETSPIVNCCGFGCPPHSFESSSLLEKGSRSLKHPNPHHSLRKSLNAHSEQWASSGAGVYGGCCAWFWLQCPPCVWSMWSVRGVPWCGLAVVSGVASRVTGEKGVGLWMSYVFNGVRYPSGSAFWYLSVDGYHKLLQCCDREWGVCFLYLLELLSHWGWWCDPDKSEWFPCLHLCHLSL